ncbi:MAG TPA: hypothetical protein PK970_12570 [Hyphomicrobiaceae bacterium]|nr:hypothetical protein [Hyphomicrobiaceae bacterium]
MPDDIKAVLADFGIRPDAPVYLRAFKMESEIEVWMARPDGTYAHVKTYPVCNMSGGLGPKTRFADHQVPEGFYEITRRQLKPDSAYHLAFNIGYPNALDRSLGRTGNLIMVHGKCQSVGCFAISDAAVEELYAVVRDAFASGQMSIPFHSFPFRMTADNATLMDQRPDDPAWQALAIAERAFDATRTVPTVGTCERRYVVDAAWTLGIPSADPRAPCPPHTPSRYANGATDETTARYDFPRYASAGVKTRSAQSFLDWPTTRARHLALAHQFQKSRHEKRRAIRMSDAALERRNAQLSGAAAQ